MHEDGSTAQRGAGEGMANEIASQARDELSGIWAGWKRVSKRDQKEVRA